MYGKVRAIISWRVSVRHSAVEFSNAIRASYPKYRSAHSQRNALACRPSPTDILLWLFFPFLRIAPLLRNIMAFYVVRAPSGNTTLRSCRAWPVRSAPNIPVYSRSIWIAGTLLNNLCPSSMFLPPTGRSTASRQNSYRWAPHLSGVSAAHLLHTLKVTILPLMTHSYLFCRLSYRCLFLLAMEFFIFWVPLRNEEWDHHEGTVPLARMFRKHFIFKVHTPWSFTVTLKTVKFGRWTYPVKSTIHGPKRGRRRLRTFVWIWRFQMYIVFAIVGTPFS